MTLIKTIRPNRTTLRASNQEARPAEVGAVAPMFEKSATELKLKSKPKHSSHSDISC